MAKSEITEAVLLDGKTYIRQPDGSLRPAEDQTDWTYLRSLSEAEIEDAAVSDPDAQPLADDDWGQAISAPAKKYIHMGVDDDVLAFFKAKGERGYQTRINAVLRQYVEKHRKAG